MVNYLSDAKTVLSTTALEKNANMAYYSSKGFATGLTKAGRAVSKHPKIFGFEIFTEVQQDYRSDAALNKLAAEGIKKFYSEWKVGD